MILLSHFAEYVILLHFVFTRSGKVDPQACSDGVNSVIDKVSALDIGIETNSKTETATQYHSVKVL